MDTVGELTVMVMDATSVHVPVVPVTVYVVVVVGVTMIVAVVWLVSLFQLYDVAPEAVKVTLVPGQTVVPGVALIVTVHVLQACVLMARPAKSITPSTMICLLKSSCVFMIGSFHCYV